MIVAPYVFIRNYNHSLLLQYFFGKKHKKGKCLKKACRYMFRNGKKDIRTIPNPLRIVPESES